MAASKDLIVTVASPMSMYGQSHTMAIDKLLTLLVILLGLGTVPCIVSLLAAVIPDDMVQAFASPALACSAVASSAGRAGRTGTSTRSEFQPTLGGMFLLFPPRFIVGGIGFLGVR